MANALTPSIITTIRGAWSADTAFKAENWNPEVPSTGQCAVTALLVQDLAGGQIFRGKIGRSFHYWNVLDTGDVVDLTIDQFPTGTTLPDPIPVNDKGLRRSVADRYQLLASRVSN